MTIPMTAPAVSQQDIDILRRLGERVAVIATDPAMAERRRLWTRLSALQGERPLVMVETGGVLDEVIPRETLSCTGDWARGVERNLRNKIFYWEQVQDDTPIEPRVTFSTRVTGTDYGVHEVVHRGNDGAGHGSYTWEAPLQDLEKDLAKLHFREYTVDVEATQQERQALEMVFDGILPVVERNWYWWTQGLTWEAIKLLGLEAFMLAMYDQPEGLHALMAFLRDDHQHRLTWFEAQGLLTLNNEDDYVGSGSFGYTAALPQPDYVPGQPARIKDLWGLSESQETVGVSPELFEEFIFPYQLPVIARFGLSYYGCCEPVDARWEIIKRIPNLRRVSVSPWSHVHTMADRLGRDYVFCRKPNPAYVSSAWDEGVIRDDLRETIEATKGLNVEIVLKDVHTVANEPWRFGRWVQMARELIDEVYG
jgi:hypothetical protein